MFSLLKFIKIKNKRWEEKDIKKHQSQFLNDKEKDLLKKWKKERLF